MNAIIKSLITRFLQPASVPGWIAFICACVGYNPSADVMSQLSTIGVGALGLLITFLNTKFLND